MSDPYAKWRNELFKHELNRLGKRQVSPTQFSYLEVSRGETYHTPERVELEVLGPITRVRDGGIEIAGAEYKRVGTRIKEPHLARIKIPKHLKSHVDNIFHVINKTFDKLQLPTYKMVKETSRYFICDVDETAANDLINRKYAKAYENIFYDIWNYFKEIIKEHTHLEVEALTPDVQSNADENKIKDVEQKVDELNIKK